MIIYFRACEKQQTISNVMRFNNIPKTIMLKKCWLSIQASVGKSDRILVISDGLSDETLNFLQTTAKTDIAFVKVPEHEWEFHQHTVTLVEELDTLTKLHPDDLHYIVEDDYLHTPDAISVLKTTLEQWNGFAVSYDYPDRYTMNTVPSYIMLGVDRHWRTVDSSTMTILAKGNTWQSIMPALKEAAPTSNDQVFNEVYKTVRCISPLPGVSTHLTDRHATPYIDWNRIWDGINE